MSYIELYAHLVFVTKRRVCAISEDKEKPLFIYIMKVIESHGCKLLRINAALNHVHLLVKYPATLRICDLVQEVKRSSSVMMKNSLRLPGFEGWSHEYAAVSVSPGGLDAVRNYIINQKEHHKVHDFLDEYRSMLSGEKLEQFSESWFDL